MEAFFITILIMGGLITLAIKNIQKENRKMETKNEKYINVTELAENYNITPKELNNIFEKMKLIKRENKWIIATELGIINGAKQQYDKKRKIKYVVWNEEIKLDENLKEEIKQITGKPKKEKMTQKEKEEKGAVYEQYIAEHFRKDGFYVWEHGKEKGKLDSGIDLFIKKEKEVYFVQCKNWENWKINHDTVQAIQTKVRNYMKNNEAFTQLLKNSNKKILYVMPKPILTKAAYAYIKENENILEYQIIEMKKE